MPTWGRGGAGNIVTESQIEETQKRLAEDLEANQPPTSTAASAGTTTATAPSPQEYAHTGRGGAGNWYEPRTLHATGAFTATAADATAPPPDTARPHVSTPYHPPGMELPVGRAGRGGAGNFVWKEEEDGRVREERERERERAVAERVVEDVEKGLARPDRAVLGQVKGGRGW